MKSTIRQVLVAAFVAAAAFCFWQGMAGRSVDGSATAEVFTSAAKRGPVGRVRPVGLAEPPRQSRAVTAPIQELRVGMRVVGRNPLDDDALRDLPDPEPESWRRIRAHIGMQPGQGCDVELLRPLDWIRKTAGSAPLKPRDTIWLDLPEMHVAGEAEVLAIEPCPAIEPGQRGTRPLITGTFRHEATSIVDVHVEGSADPIGCTPAHPFWSETREAFVAASDLQVDERVLTAYGNSARITSIVPRAGPQVVYGLEIYGEHVYHVGTATLLVHNASASASNRAAWSQVSSEYRAIIRDVEAHTRRSIPSIQRRQLSNQIRQFNRRLPVSDDVYRRLQAEYRDSRSAIIGAWERNTGQSWPQGAQAHHIIPSRYGGQNEWWNIHPAYRNIHQPGIHGSGSPTQMVFPTPVPRN